MKVSDTRDKILNSAQRLAQRRGFNAFSYADVAAVVGVRKASIHHYFPSKDDLELALVERYSSRFGTALAKIKCAFANSAVEQLRQYGLLYRATLAEGAICLCGMMASDIGALPEKLRPALAAFFREQIEWLAAALESGRRSGELVFLGPAARRAQSLLATLQGGLILAQVIGGSSLFDALLDETMADLGQR